MCAPAGEDKRAEVGSYYVDQFTRAMNAVANLFDAHRDQLLFEIERLRKEVAELRAIPMTGADVVTLFERCGVPRTEVTAGMMYAVEFAIKAERMECARVCEDEGTFAPGQDTEFDGGVEHARREFARRIRNR